LSYVCTPTQSLTCRHVLAHPALFEMLAPSQQGPVYIHLVADGKVVKIGGEFNLNAAQVEAWLAILEAARQRMKVSG
jgi:hypothetical protein